MVTKISLLKISAGASLLEHKCATQDFIIATDTVFNKAQGLAMLAPLHETVFGLLKGLLDDWHLLNLNSMKWRHRAEAPPCSKDKGKAKAMEEDDDEEDEATQKFREELENMALYIVIYALLTTWLNNVDTQLASVLAGTAITNQKAVFIIPKHIKLVQAAKAFFEWQGKLSQSFILEGFKRKRRAKALIANLEQTGTKQAFKSKEVVDSDSSKEEEERVHVIKKIKHKHVKEPIGMSKGKEIMELQAKVVPKMPVAGPLHQTLKPIVLIPGMPKSVSKPIIASATLVAGPSTAQIVPSSAPKPTATMPVPKPAPVKSLIKGGSVFKDSFMVKQFKLVSTKESGALIINQVTEVSAGKVASTVTQETLQSEEDTGNENDNDKGSNNNEDDGEGGKDNDDNSNNDNNAAMDIDSGSLDVKILKTLHPKETWPTVLTKVTVTDDIAGTIDKTK
ncbi:hypothetical protein C0995_015874 [Termitomyces sp. Mi166|nr:hypothetical protein C0995_015874 [Termitomyces sp. Mi166\